MSQNNKMKLFVNIVIIKLLIGSGSNDLCIEWADIIKVTE